MNRVEGSEITATLVVRVPIDKVMEAAGIPENRPLR